MVQIARILAASQVLIANLQCSDADGDTLTFTMKQGDPNFVVESGSGTGQLKSSAAAAFDSSAKSAYNLVVVAEDDDGNKDEVEILVIVRSVNDGAINCTSFPSTNLFVSEGTSVNTILGRMSCKDADGLGTANGQLTYSVTGSNGKIAIDPTTGVFFLADEIDFEESGLTNPVTVNFVVTDNSADSIILQVTKVISHVVVNFSQIIVYKI